jgi:hypothetical protein
MENNTIKFNTRYDVLNLLNEPVRSQAITNVPEAKLYEQRPSEITTIAEVASLAHSIIHFDFMWSATPEGWDYWNNIVGNHIDNPVEEFQKLHVDAAKVEKLFKQQQQEAAPQEQEPAETKSVMECVSDRMKKYSAVEDYYTIRDGMLLLDEPYRTQAINNATQGILDSPEVPKTENNLCEIARQSVLCSFNWGMTPEGDNYWMDIHDSLAAGKDNYLSTKISESQIKEAPVGKEEVNSPMENTMQIEHIQFGDSVKLKKLQHGQVYNKWRFTEGMEVAARDYTVDFVDLHDNTIQINGCWIPVSFVATVIRDGKQVATIEQPVAPAPTKIDINTINAGDTIILRDDLVNCDKYGDIMYSDVLMHRDKLTFHSSMFDGSDSDGTFHCNENPYLYHIDMVKEVIPCDKLKIQEQPVQEVETPAQTPLMDFSEQVRFETFVAAAIQGLSTKDSSPIMIAVRAISIAEAVMSELSNKSK